MLLNQSCEQLIEWLKEHARTFGAHAGVSIQFDSSEIGPTMTELLAYRTAVVVKKDTSSSSPVWLE